MSSDHQDPEDDGSLLSRWSRRKLAAKSDVPEEPIAAPETMPAADVPELEEDPVLKANREAAEAIDIDALTYESDFAPFLKSGVPGLLRLRAMRKLWTSHPVLANRDGLNDYDLEFATPETVPFKSAWEVGKGYVGQLTRAISGADETPTTTDDAPLPDPVELADDGGPVAVEDLTDEHQMAQENLGQTEEEPAPEPAMPRVPLRRRLMG